MEAPRIDKEELKRKMESNGDFVILDVRNPFDYAASAVKISRYGRIPLKELEGRLSELDPEREVVAYCT